MASKNPLFKILEKGKIRQSGINGRPAGELCGRGSASKHLLAEALDVGFHVPKEDAGGANHKNVCTCIFHADGVGGVEGHDGMRTLLLLIKCNCQNPPKKTDISAIFQKALAISPVL